MTPRRAVRKKTLRTKVTLAYLAIMVLPLLLICFFFLLEIERDAAVEQEKLLDEYTAQVGRSIDVIVDEINQLGRLHLMRYDILLMLRKNYDKHPEDLVADSRLMADLLGISVRLNARTYRLTLVGRYGQIFSHFFPPYLEDQESIFDRIEQAKAMERQIAVFPPVLISGGEGAYIPMIMEMRDPHTWVVVGYACIDIRYNEMATEFANDDYNSSIDVLLINDGNIIFDSSILPEHADTLSPVGEAVAHTLQEGNPLPAHLDVDGNGAPTRYVIKTVQNISAGWMVVVYSREQPLLTTFWSRAIPYLMVSLGLVAVTAFFGRRMFVGFMQQVNLLRSTMRAAQDGYIGTIDVESNIREMASLYEGYNSMASRILSSVKREYAATLLQKETEMDFLLLQINPHFLYNTLNLIRSFAQCHYVEAVDQTIVCLGEILRYSLKPARYASLEEELKHVNDYIVIQQLRFTDSVSVEKRIDDSLLSCRVIKFILQPIVENAFHHALEMKKGDRQLALSVEEREGSLIISIGDNGEGMPPVVLDNLKRQLVYLTENPEHNRPELGNVDYATGIGLINVHKRLLFAYGAGYGVWIESQIGKGTVVTLTLPVQGFLAVYRMQPPSSTLCHLKRKAERE